MNQILYVQKEKKNSTIEINKIVKFFSIAMIVFGTIMLGEGVYGAFKNNEMRQVIENTSPIISLDRDGQQLKISVSHIRPLKSMEYNWNDDEDTYMTIDVAGRNAYVQRIDLPAGENDFNITVKDINGKTTTINKEFYMENGKDITKPKIDVTVSGNNLKIIATDEKALSYITYRWNNEEETNVSSNPLDEAKIEAEIPILRGKNTIKIIAVDSSNNTISREETFDGRMKPTLQVWIEGNYLVIVGRHDVGVKQIDFSLNGQNYSVQGPVGEVLSYAQELAPGYNKVEITVYSVEDTTETLVGEATI